MPVRITWDITVVPNPTFIANAFFQTSERTSQMDTVVKQITERISQEIEANFAAEGRPDKWAPLAEVTIRAREYQGYAPGPVLTRSSDLRESATAADAWQMGSAGQLVSAELIVAEYGHFHVTGWTANTGRFVDARDWSYLPPEVDTAIDDLLSEWLFTPLEAI